MASEAVLIQRGSEAQSRLKAVKAELQSLVQVDIAEQPITNRDANLARIQETENVVTLLEAVVQKVREAKAVATATDAKPKVTKPAAKD